jgi:hypothetical protein
VDKPKQQVEQSRTGNYPAQSSECSTTLGRIVSMLPWQDDVDIPYARKRIFIHITEYLGNTSDIKDINHILV